MSSAPAWDTAWYRSYFDSVANQSRYNNVYKAGSEEEASGNMARDALVYGVLLLSPLLLVAAVAASK